MCFEGIYVLHRLFMHGNCEELCKPLINGEVCWCFMHVPCGSPKDYTLKLESVIAS